MSEIIPPIAAQVGIGGAVGFVVGYALKKLLKVMIILIGLAFVALQYLAYRGFIEIHYDKFIGLIQAGSTENLTIPSFILANLPFAGSFVVGLGLGFMKG